MTFCSLKSTWISRCNNKTFLCQRAFLFGLHVLALKNIVNVSLCRLKNVVSDICFTSCSASRRQASQANIAVGMTPRRKCVVTRMKQSANFHNNYSMWYTLSKIKAKCHVRINWKFAWPVCLASFSVMARAADVMRHKLIQAAVLSHADNELWPVASNLLDGSHHIHFLFVFQLVNDVSGTAEQTTLLYTIPSGRTHDTTLIFDELFI